MSRSRRFRRWVLAGIGLAMVLPASVAIVAFALEPRYEGVTASDWVQRLARESAVAKPALLAMGEPAAPALGRAVGYHPSWLSTTLYQQRAYIPGFLRRRMSSPAQTELVRLRAVEVLHAMGTNAAPAADALLRLDTPGETDAMSYGGLAQATLVGLGAAALPALRRGLRDSSPEVRQRAADCLARLGPTAAPAVPELRRALAAREPRVHRSALAALAAVGPAAAPVLPDLAVRLQQASTEEALDVAEAWWQIGGDAQAILPRLIATLDNLEHPQRARAAALLGRMGPAAAPAVESLRRVLTEDFSYTRVKAAEALARIAPSPRDAAATP